MTDRVSSLDEGYESGDLSLFPDAIDDRDSLYETRNNAETTLQFGLPYNARKIIVNDTSKFPPKGLLRIGLTSGEAGNAELIYYGEKNSTIFTDLIRGFAGSVQTVWDAGSYVTNAVMAEHHNAIKDAVLNVENYLGLTNNPDSNSLNGIIKQLEDKFLAPKSQFRAYPTKGPPSLTVRFQSLSGGHVIRTLWDFGDGSHSIERNPTHIYQSEGYYSVRLTVYTSIGGQGISLKSNYIKVSEEEILAFFYVVLADTTSPAYSTDTALLLGEQAAVFDFIDQTDGNIAKRIWVFADGETYESDDPNEHTTAYTYAASGEYDPMLLAVYADGSIKRAYLSEPLIVL